jgi:hypothetical protein
MDLMGLHVHNTELMHSRIANEGFGVLRADDYIAREITTLSLAYDPVSNLVTVSTLSPSRIQYRGNRAPKVSTVLPFIADLLEEALFVNYMITSSLVRKHVPQEAYMRFASGLTPDDFVINDDDYKSRPNDFIVPVELPKFKSIGQYSLPYAEEMVNTLTDNSAKPGQESTLSDIIAILQKMESTPREMQTMLELEYGPVFDYYWMAFCSLSAYENYRDRINSQLYTSARDGIMIVESPFETTTVTFSEKPIFAIKNDVEAILKEKGIGTDESELVGSE